MGNGAARSFGPQPSSLRSVGQRQPSTQHHAALASEPPTIVVPRTPDGVATALTHMSAAHLTTGPARSHPSNREHPPLVEFGSTDVPPGVRAATPDTGLTIRLPASVEYLYIAAPLAYYLGAAVGLDDIDRPTLSLPGRADHTFDPLPEFGTQAADLLRRCFYLDAAVRSTGEIDRTRPIDRLDDLDVSPEDLRSVGPAARLRAYLSLEGASLDDRLPAWHLATYVEPSIDRAPALPHLLDAMSLVYLPEATPADGPERLRRSLDDFVRSTADVPSVDVLAPRLGSNDLHAWLADGTPLDAHKTTEPALRTRLDRRDPAGPLEVAVVLNDDDMNGEAPVADTYDQASTPANVTVHRGLTRSDLAAVLTAPHDLVHYVGHCDVEGLRCVDGGLSVTDLGSVRTRAFFLNACGSYHEGRALVEKGSSAGAVTLTAVLDQQATTVGATFARLVTQGFGVARALRVARRRIMTGQDYAVVGDGTYPVVDADDPALLTVTAADADRYRVRYDVPVKRNPGRRFRNPFTGAMQLQGTTAVTALDRPGLIRFLEGRNEPTIYEDRFYWADDLAGWLQN